MRVEQKKITWVRASFVLLLAGAAGCGAGQRLRHEVPLRFDASQFLLPRDPVRGASAVIVVPFADLRRERGTLGTYRKYPDTIDFVPAGGSVSDSLTEITREFFRRTGYRPQPGEWRGDVEPLADLPADIAVFGEIFQLDFSGRGTFYEASHRGVVQLKIHMGSREARRVISRTIEVTPDALDFHLFDTRFSHHERLAEVIQKAVNKALHEGLTNLVSRIVP